MSIPVLYQDEWLVIVDKPSGLLVIPTPKRELRTLTSILNEELGTQGAGPRVYPCHRLDRETSGVIVYAKGKAMLKRMTALFRQGALEKKYIAFVHGHLVKPEGEITRAIEGKSARTRYRTILEKKGFTEVEVTPLTGRTNQIRLHFKYLGYPVVGEARFSFRKDFALKANRLCLHAYSLAFTHPVTDKKIYVRSPLPDALNRFIETH